MKRFLSLVLCLLMCVSIVGATAAEVKAAVTIDSIFSVENTGFKNGKISYIISVAPSQKKIVGAVFKIKFNENHLALSEAASGAAGKSVDGDFVANIQGIYETGLTWDDTGVYAVAFMNPNGYTTGDKATAFVEVTFTAVSDARPQTEVEIYCEEYLTDDGVDTNDIQKNGSPALIDKDSFFMLEATRVTEVASAENALKISWDSVTGAENYDLYRKTGAEPWSLFKSFDASVNEYVDDTIKKGNEYFYTVASRNQYGAREYDEAGLSGLYFGTITEIDADITETGATVTWGALNGAEKYDVFRKAENEAEWLKIGTTDKTSYESSNLTSGKTYYYTVKAYKGKYVAETSVEPASLTFISVPTVAYSQINYNDIVINWSMVAGANSYRVYRKAQGESVFKEVAVVEGNAYTDTDVVAGKEYSYKIRAIGADIESALGTEYFTITKLSIPSAVYASLGVKEITVSWEEVELAEKYNVYRKADSANWQIVATVNAGVGKYEDKKVESGKTYIYAVATIGKGFNTEKSVNSEAVYYLDSPVIMGVANASNGMEVSFYPVDGAGQYIIYRKNVGGNFSEIGRLEATDTVFVDETAESGVQYIYGVCAVYGDTTSPVCESKLACRLAEPKITSAASVYGGITITWGDVKGAEKYIIGYEAPGADWVVVATVGADVKTYTHKAPVSGRNNKYTVTAVCGDIESTQATAKVYYLAAPVINYIANGTKQVTIRWTEVDGAESYYLYRKGGEDKNWRKIAVIEDSTSYKDATAKAGVTYRYTIKAYDGDELSPYHKSGWAIRFLTTPTVSAAAAYGGIKVSWSKVAGAKGYYVYRKTGNSGWAKIATVNATTYADKSVKSNTKYTYTVKAYYGTSVSYYNTKGVAVSYIAAPVVKVANTGSGIKLSWGKVAGATKYRVYRKSGSKWVKLKDVTSLSYVDKTVKNTGTYVYTVRAYKNSLASGYNTSGWKMRFISAPKLVSVSSSKSGVTFKWKKVSGVKGYYVYRKTGSGSWVKIANVSASKAQYLDKTAKKGVTYTYTVRGYYGSYGSAYYSGLKIKDKY